MARGSTNPEVSLPDDVESALAANPAAKVAFGQLAPSHRREYLEWIEEAKRPETRARRVAGMIDGLQPLRNE